MVAAQQQWEMYSAMNRECTIHRVSCYMVLRKLDNAREDSNAPGIDHLLQVL